MQIFIDNKTRLRQRLRRGEARHRPGLWRKKTRLRSSLSYGAPKKEKEMNTITQKIETNDTEKKYCVVCQKWEESERGWGTRPDGYSLHVSFAELKIFISEYWDRMPDEVPDEYTRPCGNPYQCTVDEKTYCEIKGHEEKHGLWRISSDYPAGDTDGWMNCGGGLHGKL